jgi:hypothetical protein
MRIVKLAELLEHKYKVAASTADLEAMVRKYIDRLYEVVHKQFPILYEIFDSGASKPKDEREEFGIKGYQFIHALVDEINKLMEVHNTISMPLLQSKLAGIANLIDENLQVKSLSGSLGNSQFPHVEEIVRIIRPIGGHKAKQTWVQRSVDNDVKKAREGLKRIKSIVTTMLNDLAKMGMAKIPHGGRFEAQRQPLSVYDIIKFIRLYGGKFGIEDKEDWNQVFDDDPKFLEDMTSVVYAADRARTAREYENVRNMVLEALRRHREKTEGVNVPYFEAGEEQAKEMATPEQDETPPSLPTPANNNQKVSSRNFERLLRKYQ